MRLPLVAITLALLLPRSGAAAVPVVGPAAGYLVIHGGGGGTFCDRDDAPPACEEHLDEFVRLAGGRAASIVIVPTGALWNEADLPPRGKGMPWSDRRRNFFDRSSPHLH